MRPARDVELLVAAEAEIAVLQVEVGMAHAAAADAHQHFACRAARAPRRPSRTAASRRRSSIGGSCGSCDSPLASATKPSTAISSARAVGSRPAFSSSGMGSSAERLQARAQHLAALAEGRRGDALERAAVAGQGIRARARAAPRDDVTLGGGTKADGAMSNRIFASRAPARQHGEPAVGLRAGLRHDALGDLALEHQHEPVVPGRPRLDGEPARPAARSRCCRAGWRRRGPGRRRDRARRRTSARRRDTIVSRSG